jgi:hypothetical protein
MSARIPVSVFFLFLWSLCATLSLGTSCLAATYYISSSEGNDANDGLSPSRPWKSLYKVSLESQPGRIRAGDAVLLKRGDQWEGQMRFYGRGTAEAPMLLGAYGTGPKPVIYGDGRGLVWTPVAAYPGVYSAYVGESSIISFVYEGNEPYQLIRHSGSITDPLVLQNFLQALTPGSWGITGNTRTIWIRTKSGAFPSTIRVFRSSAVSVWSGSSHAVVENLDLREMNVGIDVTTSNFITIRNIDTFNTQNIAIYFRWDVTNSVMESNNIKNAGNTALYILTGANNIIRNNTIDGVYTTISGITAKSDECGIGLQQSRGNIIEYNRERNVKGSAVDYFFERDSIVRYNHFEHGVYPHGTNLLVYGNVINVSTGTLYAGMNLGNTGNLPIKIFHNIFYMPTNYGIMARQTTADSPGIGAIIFRNNIVYASGNTNLVSFADKVDSDYNCFYSTSTPHFFYEQMRYTSLEAYQNASKKDLHSVFADPKLTADLKLDADSGCRDAGFAVGNLIDFAYKDLTGLTIPQGQAPEMGAFEYPDSSPAVDLSVALSPSTSLGVAPLAQVSLSATVSGTAQGPIDYFFYCDRSQTGTDSAASDVTANAQELANYTAAEACTYVSSGVYTAKVVVRRGGFSAESRSLIIATPLPDTTPPVISKVTAAPGTTSATITWSTDERVSIKLEYGTTTTYGSSWSDGELGASPFSHVLTGLVKGTLYHFRVRSTDMFGNEAISEDYHFTTFDHIPTSPKDLKVKPPSRS